MRIELKKWTLDAKPELIRICNATDRKYLSNRLPFPYTQEDADWWLNMVSEQDGREGVFRAILVDGEYAGNISAEKKSDIYGKDATIGYLLVPEKCSRGIMSNAVGQLCETVFQELDIVRISGDVFEPNVASRRVLEKNGFVLEGLLKNAVYKNDTIYNLCIYGKCKPLPYDR